MGIFGWDLPPGCSMRDIDPPESPCLVCGAINLDNCICPECPTCSSVGDPICYEKHGLVRTAAQIQGKAELDRLIAEDARREQEGIEDLLKEQQRTDPYYFE